MIRVRCRVVFALVAATALSSAQQIVWQAVGRVNYAGLQEPLVFIGDIDGDGFDDLANWGTEGSPTQSGLPVIRLLSGRTGAVFRTVRPALAHYYFLRVAAAGDWNGDGVSDYLASRYAVSAPFGPTMVEVYSGRDDSILFSTRCGNFPVDSGGDNILSDLDTDGDGGPDVLCTISREQPRGAIYIYGNDGTLRYRVTLPAGQLNVRIGKVGDLDCDGCDDFGYQLWDATYPDAAVRVVSGRTGTVMLTAIGEGPGDHIGYEIVACGDVNGDGVPDFAASSHGLWPTRGIVRVFSGRDASAIRTFRKSFNQFGNSAGWGGSLASGFDLDQDGIQDLVVGGCLADCYPRRAVGDRLYVYSLRDGRELEICTPDVPPLTHDTYFGFHVTAAGAQPGNPFPVFACGERQFGNFGTVHYEGRISLFRLPPSMLRPYGTSCAGSLAGPPRAGVTDLGTAGVRVHLSAAPPSTPALLLVGASDRLWGSLRLPLALDPLGFRGCRLHTAIDVVLPATTGNNGIAAGYAAVDIGLPYALGAGRGDVYCQWLVLGRGTQAPGALSSALSWRF